MAQSKKWVPCSICQHERPIETMQLDTMTCPQCLADLRFEKELQDRIDAEDGDSWEIFGEQYF